MEHGSGALGRVEGGEGGAIVGPFLGTDRVVVERPTEIRGSE